MEHMEMDLDEAEKSGAIPHGPDNCPSREMDALMAAAIATTHVRMVVIVNASRQLELVSTLGPRETELALRRLADQVRSRGTQVIEMHL